MTIRMLIDARHREETRVAVVKGNRIEEFDFESAERKQLKGNIYLAKVTRVEPSLQAAFIDYGGNRHGFLAFSEIHPDYYQIPREDREALLREEAEHAAEEERLHGDRDDDDAEDDGIDPEDIGDADADPGEASGGGEDENDTDEAPAPRPEAVNGSGSDDQAAESLRARRTNLRHRYKIQDVIRRRQVLLVQVVKEERGNKGAALTTYLSLAGRYCVLMPNTSHGGGISRKISSPADRKRLKSILGELDLPQSMGCIVRTAGLQRTKSEIRRDFDYLARLWDEIRATTLASSAPALVYGDSDLVKRAIRDIYNKDIEEIIVEGEDSYRQARQFMKLLMPGHVKRLKHYADVVPLFQRGGVEDQLAAMYHPVVQLKSGGYLVINPTEALVSIDINSGRSTREHNIEQTALMTNLEAAHEIARQLRLRDMAGLVVIDFIDMENNSNNRKVEKAMKEALRGDRARIQVGRISSFGLFEMSRQRLRTGVLEASTRGCPHCEGTGLVRTASSAGISALRMLEEEAARGRGSRLLLRCSQEASFYVLNRKRIELGEIEERYGVVIEVLPDGSLEGARMAVEAGGPPPAQPPRMPVALIEADDDIVEEDEDEEPFEDEVAEAESEGDDEDAREERSGEARAPRDDGDRGKRRRRRRRRGGRREEGDAVSETDAETEGEAGDETEAAADAGVDVDAEEGEEIAANADVAIDSGPETGEGRRRRGRRGRRGGRGGEGREVESRDVEASEPGESADAVSAEPEAEAEFASSAAAPEVVAETEAQAAEVEATAAMQDVAEPAPEDAAPAPRPRRRPRARTADEAASAEGASVAAPEVVEAVAKPARTRRRKADAAVEPATEASEAAAPDVAAEEAPKPRHSRRRKADDAVASEPELPIAAPEVDGASVASPEAVAGVADDAAQPEPAFEDGASVAAPEAVAAVAGQDEAASTAELAPAAGDDAPASDAPARRGWWQRTFGN